MTDTDVELALRTTRPIKVVAVLDDDREVTIAIPRGTRRWERMAATLASQAWSEIRMYDKSGGLMAPPIVREAATARAPGLEDVSGNASDRLVDPIVIERIMRSTMDACLRSFVEVVKVARTSGSAEVTAALQANRETVSAIAGHADDLRRQLSDREATIADLERELAARMAADQPKAIEQSPTEKLVDRFAEGFFGAQPAPAPAEGPKAGH